MEKISSKYIIQNIISYSSFNIFLKLIQTNKKLQKFSDVSLYSYQKLFLLKKLKINFDDISTDKLIQFLNIEFKNFTTSNDKKIFEKLIEEIKKEKTFIKPQNILVKPDHEIKSTLKKEINWTRNENLIKLDLQELYLLTEDQKIIHSSFFPNLKVLYINNKFIVPCSIIINLSELIINYCYSNKLLFINDINKEEVDLNKLIYLTIKSAKKNNNSNNINKNNNNYNYKIKFRLKNLQQLTINTFSNDDNSFLINYFDLDLIYNTTLPNPKYQKLYYNNKLNNKTKNLLKLRDQYFLFVSFMKNLNYLNITNTLIINSIFSIKIHFEMKTYEFTKLKNFCFNVEHYNDDARIYLLHYLEEHYDENSKKQKILKFYKNYSYFNEINIPPINNNVNVVKIRKYARNLSAVDVNKIFDLKKNNYSVQQICLNFSDQEDKYYHNLIKNITKFKVLNKLYLYDSFPKIKIMNIIENISKLKLLEHIYIITKTKLSNQEIKTIKKVIPGVEVEINIKENMTYIKKNFQVDKKDDWFEMFK